MKLDLNRQFYDADDKVILENDVPVSATTLLKRAVLADSNPDGSAIKPDEKYNRFELFLKLKTANSDTDFTIAEIALLDSAVRVYGTLICGQLLLLLNNKT